MPTTKKPVPPKSSAKPAGKPAAKTAAAKPVAAASTARRERPAPAKPEPRLAPKPVEAPAKAKAAPAAKAAAKAEPKPAPKPVAKVAAKPAKPEPKAAAKPAKPEPAAKASAKAKAEAAKPAKPEPVAKAKPVAPAPKAKVEAKAKVEPKKAEAPAKPAAKAKPEPKKAEPKKAEPKVAKVDPKAAKPAAKPLVAAKPVKPLVAPVTTKTAPIITRPPVASGNGVRPLATPRPLAPPKPLSAPKPQAAAPEIVGDAQPVPAFKGKSSAAKGMVLVGAVAGAFGVKGEVRLRAFTSEKQGVIAYGPLHSSDGKALLKPKTWRELKDGVAVTAPEIKSREEAEAMRGTRLYVPRANLPAPAEDEFYIVDLLGCRAEAIDGTILGEITAVWNFGAGDILEYRPPNGGPNQRVTFTKDTAPLVDLAGKRVVLDPPEPEALGK